MSERFENCAGPEFGSSGYIKIIPACLSTEMGTKEAVGIRCPNCPEEVRGAVAAAIGNIISRNNIQDTALANETEA